MSRNPKPTMKTAEWKTYRTRFLVKAKKLSCSLAFTDALGRQHSGRKGDYLVESSDGVIRIAPRQIFEDVYVTMNFQDEEALNIAVANESRPDGRNQPQSWRDRRPAPMASAWH